MEYRNIYLQDLGTKSSTSDNDVIEFHFIFTIYTQRRISLDISGPSSSLERISSGAPQDVNGYLGIHGILHGV